MKTLSINKILILLAGLFMATSCSKDEIPTLPAKQTPITTFVADVNMAKEPDLVNNGFYEFGTFFTPQKNGTIENFIVTIPDDGNFRVTLWNVATESIITEEIISVSENVEKTQSITPIELAAGKQYALTINADSWKTWTDAIAPYSANIFPKTISAIRLDNYAWEAGTDQKIPTIVDNTYLAGFLDFTFQPAAE